MKRRQYLLLLPKSLHYFLAVHYVYLALLRSSHLATHQVEVNLRLQVGLVINALVRAIAVDAVDARSLTILEYHTVSLGFAESFITSTNFSRAEVKICTISTYLQGRVVCRYWVEVAIGLEDIAATLSHHAFEGTLQEASLVLRSRNGCRSIHIECDVTSFFDIHYYNIT